MVGLLFFGYYLVTRKFREVTPLMYAFKRGVLIMLNLYSVDLNLWEGAEYLKEQGKSLEDVTVEDWEGMIKGLYDWIRDLQKAEGKRMPHDERLRNLMYAYGKRRPLHFVLVTAISKSHKKRLSRRLKPSVVHAHVLVYAYCVSAVVGLIKHYWANIKGYAKSEKFIRNIPCFDDGKIMYNLAQREGKVKICVSPALTPDDLKSMYYGQFASIEKFADTGRLETNALLKSMQLYGQILVKNGYSASVKGRWLAGIRPYKRHSNAVIQTCEAS